MRAGIVQSQGLARVALARGSACHDLIEANWPTVEVVRVIIQARVYSAGHEDAIGDAIAIAPNQRQSRGCGSRYRSILLKAQHNIA
ncbi:MAG: hypothetical protein U0074_10800 [Kouleothrix sp.]